MAIPKIIHYCWYGGKPMPRMLSYCIDSWKQFLPDYKFMLWNEDNTEFDCNFVKQVYNEKNWAFVSDYVRLKAVYDYGGIYMDTDMLLLRSLNYFLDKRCFFCAEHNKSIGVGIFGAEPNDSFIGECLQTYRMENPEIVGIPAIVSRLFLNKYNLERKFNDIIIEKDIIIYPPEYFYCLPYTKLFDIHNYKKYLVENAYGVHLWSGSWHNYNELYLLRRQEFIPAFKRIFTTLLKHKKFNLTYFRKIGAAFKEGLLTPNAFK